MPRSMRRSVYKKILHNYIFTRVAYFENVQNGTSFYKDVLIDKIVPAHFMAIVHCYPS